MTTNQLKATQDLWEAVTIKTDERYKLMDGKGRCVMFGLSKERADEFARYYQGARVVRM